MADGGIFNLGELSKPATVLVEKIADGVGGLYRPIQIRRIAKAEAYAKLVNQEADQELKSLRERAISRLILEEQSKQVNMESIIAKALPEVEDSAKPEDIDIDWLTNFFDKARLFSDGEMQALWSKILAGEANEPGSFSKRTVGVLSTIDRGDAQAFTRLCSFAWRLDDKTVPLVFDTHQSIYKENNIDFAMLSHLDAIGLINFVSSEGNGLVLSDNTTEVSAAYNESKLLIRLPDGEENIRIGQVFFTITGLELYTICNPIVVDGLVDYVKNTWAGYGIEVCDSSEEPNAKNA